MNFSPIVVQSVSCGNNNWSNSIPGSINHGLTGEEMSYHHAPHAVRCISISIDGNRYNRLCKNTNRKQLTVR